MELHCPECGQHYRISDYRFDDRDVYFRCERCDHRIEITRQQESWTRFRVFADKILTIADLPDGLTFSFNLKNVLTSYGFLILTAFLAGITGLVMYAGRGFFGQYPAVSGFFLVTMFLLMNYLWDIMLYLVSKNTISLIETHKNRVFSETMAETRNDLFILFIFSVVLPLVFIMFVLPLAAMGQYGVVYAGVMNPVLFTLSLLTVLVAVTKNALIGFISTRSRSLRYTIRELGRFISVEHVNIPAYMAAVSVMSSITALVVGLLLVAGFAPLVTGMLAGSARELAASLTGGNISGALGGFGKAFASLDPGFSTALFLLTGSVIAAFFIAYYVSHVQVLYTSALYIMEKDPGKSVNRGIALIVTSAILVIFLAVIFNHAL